MQLQASATLGSMKETAAATPTHATPRQILLGPRRREGRTMPPRLPRRPAWSAATGADPRTVQGSSRAVTGVETDLSEWWHEEHSGCEVIRRPPGSRPERHEIHRRPAHRIFVAPAETEVA